MKYLFAFSLILFAVLASAQEPVSEPPAAKEESNLLQLIADHFYRETTENIVSLSEKLDSFFPNPDNHRFDYRRSRLLTQIGLQVDSKGDSFVLQRINGRIVLPRMEERLSLYFEGEGEDLTRTEEATTTTPNYFPIVEDAHFRFGFNTALRLVFTKSDFYLVQNQLGARLYPTWEPYDEVTGRLRIPLGKNFLWQPGQILFWRDSVGFGETTRYDLDYALNPSAIVRLHQEGTSSQKSNGYDHLHSLSFFHQLSENRSYSVVIEGRGETSPVRRMTQYLVVFSWKELIYRNWLSIDTGSKITFDREDSFDPVPAIFFSLIADFNGKKCLPLPTRSREENSSEPH